MDQFSEIEVKYDAFGIRPGSELRDEFIQRCMKESPSSYKYVEGTDYYYRQGVNVIRIRSDGEKSQMTVKQRKSTDSTTDRVEVDLDFAQETSLEHVQRFVMATGFKSDVILHKGSHIWNFRYPGFEVCVALYDVEEYEEGKLERKGEVRTFLEVEVEKSSKISAEDAVKVLENWSSKFESDFPIDGPLNDSLYEIYSGNQYTMEESK